MASAASPIAIRLATVADAESLARLARRTFSDTFAPDNSAEDLALHLERAFTPAQQARELVDAAVRTLLLHVGPALAAYAQLRRSPTPECVASTSPIELWRFYVAKDWHGQGIAQTLMQRVVAEAGELGAESIWLGVWERNPRAISFYRKAGFVDVGSHGFLLGHDAQTDRIMVRVGVAAEAPMRHHI